jgi:CDP-diacylglycerol--glycerol-3-phosphate 3-phosphatidyltransferase
VTIPNIVTLARLGLIPFILWFTPARSPRALWTAALLFVLAAASDWFDGFLARRLKQFSRFGTILDPVVDKMLVLSILFLFTHITDTAGAPLIPRAVFLLLLLREFLVSAIRHGLTTRRKLVGANWMGKTKFCLQIVTIALGYTYLLSRAHGTPLPGTRAAVYWAAVTVTAVAYIFLARFIAWHAPELFTTARRPPETD